MRQGSEHTSVLQSTGSTSTSQGTVTKALKFVDLLIDHLHGLSGIEFITVIFSTAQVLPQANKTLLLTTLLLTTLLRAVSSQFHFTTESISWAIFLFMVLWLVHVLYLVSRTRQIHWIHIWLHFGGRHVICQTLLCLYKWFWLVIASLYYIAATENLLSTLQFAELARDWLHSTGKYAVEGGIISPVHDAYGKKVHEHNYVKTAYMYYSRMWLHPVLQAAATCWTEFPVYLELCMS